ncbi:CHAT domain-containing protein [Roseomonas eburnea]|uniref:CHAT domain-containing protein n=1 Tax=Neoroseomonas eburnea TaxID=1346889 RepID=A0A9X9XFL4_9PROT|nr:CHAT domain-containing protein [Neoroseomonas eburnea]
MRVPLAALLLAGLSACTEPSPDAYVTRSASATAGEPAGTDARNEACQVQPGRATPADRAVLRAREVFCGGWTQPAARVVELQGSASEADLDALAASGLWRSWLEQRVTCGPPTRTTIAGGASARLLACTRRAGGWPHVAVVAAGPSGPVVADGVATAMPVIERLAAGQSSGGGGAGGRSAALELAVARLSAGAFGASDVGRYEQLMALGRDLNQTENFAAAEDAYRAALAVQERVLGRDNPNAATAMLHLAVNLSNQKRLAEAQMLLDRAATLAPRAADPATAARVLHYRGLHALNAGEPAAAVDLLQQAEAGYIALVPNLTAPREGDASELLADPLQQSAVLGLAEAKRNRAVALSRAGRGQEASALAAEARQVLRRAGLEPNMMVGRSLRTEAGADIRLGRSDAAAGLLERAAGRFGIAAPGERPEAVTLFLAGQQRLRAGRRAEALSAFRAGADILRARQIGLPVGLVIPYLDALDQEAAVGGGATLALRAEMFGAAQLAQRSSTARYVQQASARLGVSEGNQAVQGAVRGLQDADRELRELFAERDASGAQNAALDDRIAAAQQRRAEAESQVAAAAPGYRQLLLAAVDADSVARALGPNEALVTMLLGPQQGFVIAVRHGRVDARRIPVGEEAVAALVSRVRRSSEIGPGGVPRFDAESAQELHRLLIAPLAGTLDGAETLVVAPDGPLLALPFGLLLAGPVQGDALGAAPWLIRRHAIVHVPSPQTLVTLRAAGTGSTAPLPYVGFGDFVPPSGAQFARSFPADRCGRDARLATGLGRLPGTRAEVTASRALLGAAPDRAILGADFTLPNMRRQRLDQYRVVHLATHALLPGELSCLTEPSIVASPPAGAPSADPAFLKASEVLDIKMDADLVILSACNTGGPGGEGGGEALSGLARAFFYAGARGLMVTHWAVDDAAAALTVADTLRRQQGGASSAASLRGAQMLILDEAGRNLPAAFAHPYYWAPFVLIGDGRRSGSAAGAGAQAPAPARL